MAFHTGGTTSKTHAASNLFVRIDFLLFAATVRYGRSKGLRPSKGSLLFDPVLGEVVA